MGTLEQCVKTFDSLLYKEYILTLENGLKVIIHFEKGNFYHLIGLHKLTDLPQLCGKDSSASKIYKDIRRGKIAHKDICKSQFYYKIENRINYFSFTPDLLHSKIIIDFDKSKLSYETELQNTQYILFKRLPHGYAHLTLGDKGMGIYPETFFYEPSKRYTTDQKFLDVIRVQIIDKEKNRKQRLTFQEKR